MTFIIVCTHRRTWVDITKENLGESFAFEDKEEFWVELLRPLMEATSILPQPQMLSLHIEIRDDTKSNSTVMDTTQPPKVSFHYVG